MLNVASNNNLRNFFGHRVMVVVAHPDDETLGAGGTLARLGSEGVETHVLFLADGETSRFQNVSGELPEAAVARRREQAIRALKIQGCRSFEFKEFPDNRLDTVPLLDIAREIEATVSDFAPETIITHSSSDLNIDHKTCLQAALIASRPGTSNVLRVLSFEVASSTGLGYLSAAPFNPNLYIDISDFMTEKIQALGEYTSEIPPTNHPRSIEVVERLARFRGDQSAFFAAEAFEVQRVSL